MIEMLNNMADKWFAVEVSMLWQVAVLIAIIFAIDLVIKRFAWPQLRYALWLLILVKLILPPSLTSPASFTAEIPSLAKRTVNIQLAAPQINQPIIETAKHPEYIPAVPQPAETIISPQPAEPQIQKQSPKIVFAKQTPSWKVYAALSWLAGVVVLSLWLTIRLKKLRKEHISFPKPVPERFQHLLEETVGKLKLKTIPKVILTDKVCCPAVFGLFKPVLLIPADKLSSMSRQDTEHILLHELAHIKRGDLIVHAVYMMLQIIYWFNPLLWLIRKQLQNLRELCCDATVARILKEKTFSYRETLLETARQLLAEPIDPGLGLLGLFENSNWLVDRLKWLEKKTWKNRPIRILTIFVLVCLMSATVLPMAKFDPGPPSFVIKGIVTDAQTGQPIAGAKVGDNKEYNDGKFCTVTDSNGHYEYKTWYEEHGTIAEADGYKSQLKGFNTKIFGSEKEKVIDFELTPEKNINYLKEVRFKIVDEVTKEPLKNRELNICRFVYFKLKPDAPSPYLDKKANWYISSVTTDDNGVFTLDLSSIDAMVIVVEPAKPYNIVRFTRSSGGAKEGSLDHISIFEEASGTSRNLWYDLKHKIVRIVPTYGQKEQQKTYEEIILVAKKLKQLTPEKPAEQSEFKATLPNGVTVEVLGICEYPSEGKQWWRPDGTPFTLPAEVKIEDNISRAGDKAYQFLFSYNSQENLVWNSIDAICLHFAIEGHSDTDLINFKRMPKGDQNGLVAKVAIFKESLDSTTIQANLATGTWQTKAVRDISKFDQRNEDLYWFTAKSAGYTTLEILHRIKGQQIKTIAIDREGNEYNTSYSLGSFGGWASISQIDGRRYVAGLRKDDRLVKFKLQSRPYWSTVIGNVSLKPNFKTDVQIEVEKNGMTTTHS